MALIIPVGYAHAIIPLRLDDFGRAAAVTMGFKVDLPLEDPDDIADAVQAGWMEGIGVGLDSAVTSGPTVVRWRQDGGEPLSGISATSAKGESVEASPPPNVAVLLRKSTSTGGRRGRGRMYVPWWANEGNIDEAGNLASGFVTAAQAQVDDTLEEWENLGLGPVVLHNEEGETPAGSPSAITRMVVDARVATQRRRLGR